MKILGYVLLILGLVVAPALAWFPTAPPSSVVGGVTNGDAHDHSGGDGAQIDHTGLANIGTNSHAQIDNHITNAGTIYTLNQGTLADTYICVYDLATTSIVCNTDPASFLAASNNLSDLTNAATARANLGVPYVEKTDCSGESSGCCWDTDGYVFYCWDGSDQVPVGKKEYNSPDNITGDLNTDTYLDQAVLADLTYGISSGLGTVRGKIYPVNGLDVDPGGYKITVGPDTIFSFNDNDPSADTIVRSSGSWITDGVLVGHRIKVSGSTSNDGYYTVASVVALTITLIPTDALSNESAGASITILAGNHYFVVYAPDGNYYALFTEMGEWKVEEITSSVTIADSFCVAISDESTDLTTGTAKRTFRMPWAMTLDSDGLRASVGTAPVGSTIIIDVNEGGTTIMSATKLSIDASEKTSTTAATAAVISDTALADDAEITIDIDQVGSSTAGVGAKVCFRGTRSW